MHRSRFRSTGLALAVLLVSCGGGSDEQIADTNVTDTNVTAPTSGGITTVTVGDIEIALEVPEGAIPTTTNIEITAGEVPEDLAQISDVTVYAFNLEPSGLIFSEPATITFRFAAPLDAGTPLALVLIEGEDSTLTSVPSESTRRDDEIEVTASVDHFSQAHLVLNDGTEVILVPELLELHKGETGTADVRVAQGQGAFEFLSRTNSPVGTPTFAANVLPVASDVIDVKTEQFGTVTVTCLKESDGVMSNAYEALIQADTWWSEKLGNIAGRLVGADIRATLRLLGDVRCDAAPSTTGTKGETGPVAPDRLKIFQPIEATNDGNGKITVCFAGPIRDLVEGEKHVVDMRVEAIEGGIRVFATRRNLGGELMPNGATFNDADKVTTADGKGSSIAGVPVDTVWEWISDNKIVVTMVSTEGVPIPTTEPTVKVEVQEEGFPTVYTFIL